MIDETLERLSRAKYFTKLDIRQASHKIRIHPDSEDLTTFRTRYGSYKYRVVPFGLTNGPATFQRFINDNFLDCLDDFLTAYPDDLLIYSENELDHEIHVKSTHTPTSSGITGRYKEVRVPCAEDQVSRVYRRRRRYRLTLRRFQY